MRCLRQSIFQTPKWMQTYLSESSLARKFWYQKVGKNKFVIVHMAQLRIEFLYKELMNHWCHMDINGIDFGSNIASFCYAL